MPTSNKDEQDIDTKKVSNQTPESEEKQHLNGPVNVDKPGWKSSQDDQGSGVSEDVSPVNVDTSGWKSSQGGQGSGVFDFETGRDMPMTRQSGEEETSREENVSGTRTDVGGEVASVGGQIPGPDQVDIPSWVKGGKEEDNQRYRDLLQYMEEKRKDARNLLAADEERKRESKKKKESWALLRESTQFLKENEGKWRQRKIEECEKIKEEEKKDRLAVCREKKKRYGIPKLSKEENMRIKIRTEERLELARAKENLWKKFREEIDTKEITENERDAWENLKRSIMSIEEEETGLKWESAGSGREIWKIIIRGKLSKEARSVGREDPLMVEEKGEENSVKSVKERIEIITSKQAMPEIKEVDESVKVEVPTVNQVKGKAGMWESKGPVKEMAKMFEEGEKRKVTTRSRMVSSRSVSELSSRWEGGLPRRGDLPGQGGHVG